MESEQAETNASNVTEFSVSEISNLLKRTVEDSFSHVRVRGEISGFRGAHSSGHCYFALKDDRSRLEAVIWRGVASRLRHFPEEGMEVIATGKLTTYPGSSKYQIVIENLEPAGAGALMALLEQRKNKLAAEGLFAPERKQLLPYLPTVIGVITSPTGSVIRDVLHRIADRFPLHVIVWPVRVQGETSGAEVAKAIEGFNKLTGADGVARPDIIIVARGGGSIEDLWGFNEEAVVRAAANSAIPLVSAVGHETDWTLIDLAADLRAPTPTGAAELAVPVKAELEALVATLASRLKSASSRKLDQARTELRAAVRGLGSAERIVEGPRQRLDAAAAGLVRGLMMAARAKRDRLVRIESRLSWRGIRAGIERSRDRVTTLGQRMDVSRRQRIERQRERLDVLQGRSGRAFIARVERARARFDQGWRLIASLSHERVLERGFALVRDAGGNPVTRAAAIRTGDGFSVQLRDGAISAVAVSSEAGGARAKPAKRKDDPENQGNLF
ncbi:MAG: exodeoxyribonuclease VII large subunit [Nitratireductor sp.]|nr:exodeoxyribonuclease VII large subunit [Nitratireductor sp.]